MKNITISKKVFIKYEFWLAVLAPRLKCVIYRDINVKRLSIFIAFSEGVGEGKENIHGEKERKSDYYLPMKLKECW